jgi:murein DD-endopeptidase MepM/ murein hydrolase activator NlpD
MMGLIQFDAPVGTVEERAALKLWPGAWYDATGFNKPYPPDMHRSDYHTGVDLNLAYNADAHAPVYAVCFGFVVCAHVLPVWGKVIVVKHILENGELVWSRYAHLETMTVTLQQMVTRGDQLGTIGNSENTQPWHLHFDMAHLDLGLHPADWPGTNRTRLVHDYIDPLAFIKARHLGKEHDQPIAPVVPTPKPRIITATPNLRVREQPNTSSAVIGYLTTGSRVVTTLEQNGWGLIDTPYHGWISLAYTQEVRS